MPRYLSARYSDQPRYLRKTLREVAHQIERLAVRFSPEMARQRIDEDPWSAVELIGFLRDSEREDLRTVRLIISTSGTPIEDRHAQYGPAEQHYRDREEIDELFWDFVGMREELLWILSQAERAWGHVGQHPFRGEMTLASWVQEIPERDLDVMWRLGRILDHLNA